MGEAHVFNLHCRCTTSSPCKVICLLPSMMQEELLKIKNKNKNNKKKEIKVKNS